MLTDQSTIFKTHMKFTDSVPETFCLPIPLFRAFNVRSECLLRGLSLPFTVCSPYIHRALSASTFECTFRSLFSLYNERINLHDKVKMKWKLACERGRKLITPENKFWIQNVNIFNCGNSTQTSDNATISRDRINHCYRA